MAYIKASETKEIRKILKQKYPTLKFSVTTVNYSQVNVAIVSGDIDFNKEAKSNDATAYVSSYGKNEAFTKETNDILDDIQSIAKGENWHDRSDSMTDYFDTKHYINIELGKCKPYELKAA